MSYDRISTMKSSSNSTTTKPKKLYLQAKDLIYGGPLRWLFEKIWRLSGIENYRYSILKKLTQLRAQLYASPTFCPLPWVHFSVSSDQTMRLCCNNEGSSQVRHSDGRPVLLQEINSLEEYVNLPFMRKTRLQMLRGEEPQACSKCFNHERAGSLSMRQTYQAYYSQSLGKMIRQTQKDGSLSPNVRYLDLAMGNNCNIRCRMCSPSYSKQLRGEFDQHQFSYGKEMADRAEKAWSKDRYRTELFEEILENTDQMLLTGGEPFLIEGQYRLMEQAVAMGRAPSIKVTYHTNLTVLPQRLLKLWPHFKEIRVHGSIEGIGPLNDYIRYPSQWHKVDKNLRELLKLKKELPLWVEVHSVFQAYNLTRVTELLDYLLQFHQQMPSFPFFNYLHHPTPLKVNVIDRDLREKTMFEIKEFIKRKEHIYFSSRCPFVYYNQLNHEAFQGHYDLMMAEDPNATWSKFLEMSHALDQSRQQKIESVLPELF